VRAALPTPTHLFNHSEILERECALGVVGLDAANVVRVGCVEIAHQLSKRVLESDVRAANVFVGVRAPQIKKGRKVKRSNEKNKTSR
jgi:hypothetical protein